MKKLAVVLGAIVALFLIASLSVPVVVPKETIRDQIVSQLDSATGWRLRIDGDIDVSALPFLKLSAKEVGVSGEAGADGIEFVTMREVRFGLSLFSLLSGVVEITGVTLVEPNLFLETDRNGRTSWEPRKDLVASEADEQAEEPETTGGDPFSVLDRLRFGAITIEDGLAVWDDQRAGVKHAVSAINVTARMPSLRDAARLDGSIAWNDIGIAFDISLAEPLAVMEGRETGITGEVSAGGGTITVDGTANPGPQPAFDGQITAEADSLKKMIATFGAPAPRIDGMENFSLKTGITFRDNAVALSDFTLGLDETTLTGSLTAALNGIRPTLTGGFSADKINLDLYRPKGTAAKEKKAGAKKKKKSGDTPVDLTPLQMADVDLGLKIGALTGGDVKVEGIDGKLTLADGKLDLKLAEIQLLGGKARATLNADASGTIPTFAGTLWSSGLSLPQMLKLAGRNDPVTGVIHSDLAFSAKGKTVSALTGSLALNGAAGLNKGSVSGLGLAKSFGGDKRANRIENLSVVAKIAGLGKPINVTGGLGWRGERFKIEARATPSALAAGAPSPVKIRVGSKRVTIGFDGKASTSGKADGRVLIETPSVRKLAKWLGNPLPPGKGLEKFRFAGGLAFAKNTISFKKAKISLDGTDGTGSGRVALSGARPKITGKLALSVLKLDPYLSGGGKKPAPSSGKQKGWSTEPIDLSGLKSADADLDLTAKGIHWDKLKIGQTKLDVKLAGGKLTVKLGKMALYRGNGSGRVIVDGSGKAGTVDATFKLAKLSAFPFLRDAADFEYIEGAANMNIALKTRGRSQRDYVSALDGNAGFDFRDGAIRGINIAKMLRSLSIQTLLGWQESKAAKTDFSVFTTKFKITDGVAKSTVFRLVGPLVRVGGGGTVHMPKQSLDWKVDPKLVASLEGQRGGGKKKKAKKAKKDKDKKKEKLAGLGVPVIIKGPWANPQIYPDIKGILSNPSAAYEKLKGLGGGLLSGTGIDALSGDGIGGIADKALKGKGGLGGVTDLIGGKSGKDGNAAKGLNLNTLGGLTGDKSNAAGKKKGKKKKGQKKAGNKQGNKQGKKKKTQDQRDMDAIFESFNKSN